MEKSYTALKKYSTNMLFMSIKWVIFENRIVY